MMNVLGMVGVLASESVATFDVSTIMQSAVTSVQGDVMKTLTIVVPALVIITGAVAVVTFGLKWLRKLGKA